MRFKKFLYAPLWFVTCVLSFVGLFFCLLTEVCSLACDQLDVVLARLAKG